MRRSEHIRREELRALPAFRHFELATRLLECLNDDGNLSLPEPSMAATKLASRIRSAHAHFQRTPEADSMRVRAASVQAACHLRLGDLGAAATALASSEQFLARGGARDEASIHPRKSASLRNIEVKAKLEAERAARTAVDAGDVVAKLMRQIGLPDRRE